MPADQFAEVAAGWSKGLGHMRAALEAADPAHCAAVESDLRIARAAWIHFRTSANQTRFVLARNRLARTDLSAAERTAVKRQLVAVIDDETRPWLPFPRFAFACAAAQ